MVKKTFKTPHVKVEITVDQARDIIERFDRAMDSRPEHELMKPYHVPSWGVLDIIDEFTAKLHSWDSGAGREFLKFYASEANSIERSISQITRTDL